MPVCERCHLDNPPGRHFCLECGYYVQWEPTAEQPVASRRGAAPTLTQPGVPPRRVEPSERRPRRDPLGGVALSLAVPGESASPNRPVAVSVEAGGEAQLVALVRNRGEVVDHYEIRVDGIPEGWWTAEPALVELLPWGSGSAYEATAVIRLHPPRRPEARAAAWPIVVRAVPRATVAAPAEAGATVTVLPFGACAAAVTPETVTGRRKGHFAVRVRNEGNAPLSVDLSARDAEDACRVAFAPPVATLAPGESVAVAMTVRARRPVILGRRRERPLVVTLAPAAGTAPPSPLRAIFRQRPWLPGWVAYAVAAAVTVATAAFLLWPRTAIVPDLSHAASAFQAQQILQRAGLALDPTSRGQVSRQGPPGAVIDQSPHAGVKVRRGTRVAVLVALGSGRDAVPNVIGLTLPEADQRLAGHFKLGKWQPDDAPDSAVIRVQWPVAGEVRQDGTPVNVSLDAGTAPAPAVVPAAGGPAAAVVKAPFAFDDGTNLFLARPGVSPEPLSDDGRATEASWTADGSALAYMRWDGTRGRIFAFSPGGYPGQAVSGEDGDFHRPAVSRDGSAVAFVDHADGAVCIAPLPADPSAMRCVTDRRWAYQRVAWSSDGRALLAVARGRDPKAGDGVVRYALPGSAAAWKPAQAQATLAFKASDVQAIAVAPTGDKLALTLGAAGGPGAVYVGSAAPGAPAPQPLKDASACDIAWTADGRLTLAGEPCGTGGPIEVVAPDGTRAKAGTGSSPAWQPEVNQ